jgi:hypothetical protein
MRHVPLFPAAATALLMVCAPGACLAGRPLTVDDANVNALGERHIEAWGARDPGDVRSWNLATEFGLGAGTAIGASLARDPDNRQRTTSLQIKRLLTPSRPDGCNAGFVAGLAHSGSNAAYVNGLGTCNRGSWAAHLNLGALKPVHAGSLPAWGMALERTLGHFTVHAETFGQRHAKPALLIGARTALAENLQLDATVGRQSGRTLYSIGTKIGF